MWMVLKQKHMLVVKRYTTVMVMHSSPWKRNMFRSECSYYNFTYVYWILTNFWKFFMLIACLIVGVLYKCWCHFLMMKELGDESSIDSWEECIRTRWWWLSSLSKVSAYIAVTMLATLFCIGSRLCLAYWRVWQAKDIWIFCGCIDGYDVATYTLYFILLNHLCGPTTSS